MSKIEEEVPTTNISGGEVSNPENKGLGKIKGQKKLEPNKCLILYRRWRTAAETP